MKKKKKQKQKIVYVNIAKPVDIVMGEIDMNDEDAEYSDFIWKPTKNVD